MIGDFVDGCKFERPFHLVVIDSRGTVSVTRYGIGGIERVPERANRLKLISPLTVTCISGDGRGRSARIEIEAARIPTPQ
jgi:hypothetical protein